MFCFVYNVIENISHCGSNIFPAYSLLNNGQPRVEIELVDIFIRGKLYHLYTGHVNKNHNNAQVESVQLGKNLEKDFSFPPRDRVHREDVHMSYQVEGQCSTGKNYRKFVHTLCTHMVIGQFPVWAGIKQKNLKHVVQCTVSHYS